MKWGKNERDTKERGLVSLFGDMEEVENAFDFILNSNAKEIERNQLLQWEKELIGVYIVKHPLAYLNDFLKERTTHTTAQITEELEKQKVVVGGNIIEARRITTKKGDTMCVFKLEDMYGSINVTVFPRLYEENPDLWADDNKVIVRGEVQVRRDEPGILCNSAEKIESAEEEINRKQYQVWITLHRSGDDERSVSDDIIRLQDVYNCLRDRTGRDHYDILVVNGEWQVLLTPGDNTMHYSKEVHEKLETLLGKGAVEAKLIER